jgi:hypothetical protein
MTLRAQKIILELAFKLTYIGLLFMQCVKSKKKVVKKMGGKGRSVIG